MHNLLLVWWHGASCQKKTAIAIGMIDIISYRIPKLRRILPLINQTRLITFHEFGDIHICHLQVELTLLGICHI